MAQLPRGLCTCRTHALGSQEPRILCDHQAAHASQVHWLEYLSGFNYVIRYWAGRLGTKPDALTHRNDVYPRGENAYALANPHNFQSMFKAGQLLRAIVLDSESLLVSIRHGLLADLIAQSHLTRLRVGPDSTTTVPATAATDLWSLSQDGDFLRYKGLLYIPDNQDVRLDILCSHHDHRLAGPSWHHQDDQEHPSSVLLA